MTDDITLINAYSIIITTISTIVLALITIFYAIETHKMRIGAKAPMLSIQCDFAFGEHDLPRKLYLCNYGPVAQNLTVNAEVKAGTESTVLKKYLYSMAQGERTEIVDNFYDIKDRNGEIVVRMKYYDANMKEYRSEIIVDFNQMTADRIISVPEPASSGIADLGDLLSKLPER